MGQVVQIFKTEQQMQKAPVSFSNYHWNCFFSLSNGKSSEWQNSSLTSPLLSLVSCRCQLQHRGMDFWQTKSDGETRSCFLSRNRTSLSLYAEKKESWTWLVILIVCLIWETVAWSRAEQSYAHFTVILIRGRWVINVKFVAVRRVRLIKVRGHSEAQIPQNRS